MDKYKNVGRKRDSVIVTFWWPFCVPAENGHQNVTMTGSVTLAPNISGSTGDDFRRLLEAYLRCRE